MRYATGQSPQGVHFLALEQLCLQFLSFRKIMNRTDQMTGSTVAKQGERDESGKRGVVTAAELRLARPVTCLERGSHTLMRRTAAVSQKNQFLNVIPNRLPGRPAEQIGCRVVPVHNFATCVGSDDGSRSPQKYQPFKLRRAGNRIALIHQSLRRNV